MMQIRVSSKRERGGEGRWGEALKNIERSWNCPAIGGNCPLNRSTGIPKHTRSIQSWKEVKWSTSGQVEFQRNFKLSTSIANILWMHFIRKPSPIQMGNQFRRRGYFHATSWTSRVRSVFVFPLLLSWQRFHYSILFY